MKTPLHGADGVLQQNRRHWKEKKRKARAKKICGYRSVLPFPPAPIFLPFPPPTSVEEAHQKIPAADDPRTHQRRFDVDVLAEEREAAILTNGARFPPIFPPVFVRGKKIRAGRKTRGDLDF